MLRSFLISILAVLLLGCPPNSVSPEAVAAHVVGRAANEAVDQLAAEMRAEGMAEIADSKTADEARSKLAAVEERWAPVWAAVEAFREAHGAYADALEGRGEVSPAALLPTLRVAYCGVRAEARPSVAMPDFPGEPCP